MSSTHAGTQLTTVMPTLQTLHRVALLGTDRAARQLPTQPLPSGAVRGTADTPVWALQWLAQCELIRRAAGANAAPLDGAAPLPRAPEVQGFDTPRFMPPAAQTALAKCLALGDSGAALLVDGLNRAQAAQFCLPYALLHGVMGFMSRYPALCAQSKNGLGWQGLLGVRGQWLAAHNPAWAGLLSTTNTASSAAVTGASSDDWDTADTEQRLALLATLRQSAAAQARGLIEATRASDPPAEVARYVQTCTVGLSMDDHDWLEGLLDAKHKAVRNAALLCLAKLPHSALCLRAVAYLTDPNHQPQSQPQTNPVSPVLTAIEEKRGLFGLLKHAASLTVTLPQTEGYDKAMEKRLARDGYELKARASTVADAPAIGPKMALVLQWLGIAPLDVLCERLSMSNAQLFAVAAAHESGEDLINALAQSLLVQARAPAHVVDALLATEKVASQTAMALIARLPFEHKEAYILKPSTRCGVDELCTVFTVEEGIGEPLSVWILNFLRKCKHDTYNRAWSSNDTVQFALRLDLAQAEQFLAEVRAEQAHNVVDAAIDKSNYAANFWKPFLQALELSTQLRRALDPSSA